MLENQVAKEFREWVQDIKAPEEFFYATLARVDRQSAIDLDKKIYMGKKFHITGSSLYFCQLFPFSNYESFLPILGL